MKSNRGGKIHSRQNGGHGIIAFAQFICDHFKQSVINYDEFYSTFVFAFQDIINLRTSENAKSLADNIEAVLKTILKGNLVSFTRCFVRITGLEFIMLVPLIKIKKLRAKEVTIQIHSAYKNIFI